MITALKLRIVFDSRARATVEAEISTKNFTARAIAPSGASVGKHEVPAFPKAGADAAIKSFLKVQSKLVGQEANYHVVDSMLYELDPGHAKYGGNLAIAISLATAKLQALEAGKELYEIFNAPHALPRPLGNVIGGGSHSGKGSPEIQEFLCSATGAKTVRDAAFANARVHAEVGKKLLKKDPEFTRARSDEGAWAPKVSTEEALKLLATTCEQISTELGFKIQPGLDVAASEFYNEQIGRYNYKKGEKSSEEQVSYMADLVEKYNLFYLEDPFQEDDFESFTELTKQVKCLVVGDDLITTNYERLKTAVLGKAGNALIVKPNQIGLLSETEKVLQYALDQQFTPIVSHRSGETEDVSIAHLATGFSAPFLKCGITGSERVSKINELLRLEESGLKLAKFSL